MSSDKIPAAAQWITLADWRRTALPVLAPFVALRRDLVVPARGGGRLELCLSASAGYTLWIDGELVASGPARSWPGRWLVDRHDLSGRLAPGAHRLALLLHPPTSGKAYGLTLPLAACGWVRAGRRLLAVTDASWRTRAADWIRHHHLLSALPTGWQEHHAADASWTTAEPGEGWAPANVLGPLGDTPPWGTAELHALPPAVETPLAAPPAWSGRIAYDAEPAANLRLAFQAAEARPARTLPDVPEGGLWLDGRGRNALTLDTGRTRTLRPGCRVLAVEGRVRLDCFLDIELRERPQAGAGFGLDREGGADSLLADRPQAWWRTQPRGGRFVTWCASGPGRALVVPLCRAVEHPYGERARLACDDPFFQRLWEVAGQTIRAATTDVLVDTCFRENSLWTFDACATGLGAFYRFGETAMPAHCLRLVADGVQADGTVPGIVPSEGEGMACMLPDQTLAWVHACLRHYELGGDAAWARAVLPAMRRALGFVERHLREGFFEPPPWSWHWVDWAAIDKRPHSAVVNLLALRAARATAGMARLLGEARAAREAGRLAATLAASCRRFRDPRHGAWRSSLTPAAGRRDPGTHSCPHDAGHPFILHANALALGLGLAAGARQERQLAACCAGLLARPGAPEASCGPGWVADLLTPCCATTDPAVVRRYLEATFGADLAAGAPTFGERFGGDRFNTAHGWGACVVALLVEGLLGLRPAAPGWRSVRFAPRWPGEGDVTYELATAAGTMRVARRDGRWRLDLPAGVRRAGAPGTGG